MERKRQFMDDSVWDKIVSSYIIPYRHINSKTPPTIIFHKDSETLLDKKLPYRFRSLPPDVKIDIYTNGVLLPVWKDRKQDFIDILSSLPNQCRLLMSYHPFNYNNSVNDYTKVIEYLRDVLKSPPSNIEFITSSHKSKWVSEGMQNAWRDVWNGLPITVHCNTDLTPWAGFTVETATVKFNGCPYGDFSHWFFGVTGNVIACCLDLEEEIILGNVLKDDPEDMLKKTDEFYAQQRALLNSGERVNHEVCANCYGQKRADEVPVNLIPLGVKIA